METVPSLEQVDATPTLRDLRAHERATLRATREHENVLIQLQGLYKHIRAKMYREHKSAVIAEDNSALSQFQAGCPRPKEAATKEDLDAQTACMQHEALEMDDSDLGLLMRRHLESPILPLPPGAACAPFRQIEPSQLPVAVRDCITRSGSARWTAKGLVDAAALPSKATAKAPTSSTSTPANDSCGRIWLGTAETRCLLRGKDLAFFGNSVVRRQMYTVLDLLAGPVAHRQLSNFTDVLLPHPDSRAIARSWIWDQDNMARGYHASQLFTVDLETGARSSVHMAHLTYPLPLREGLACTSS